MTLFASPDFGASGGMVCCLLLGWALIFASMLVGVYWGARLCQSKAAKVRVYGVLLMAASGGLPLFCCLAPPHIVRIIYGNYPIGEYPSGKIREGMSKQEVTAILGKPHGHHTRANEETWYYWIDSFDIHYFAVRFGPDGKVAGTHGN
jgi:hypothetical protein